MDNKYRRDHEMAYYSDDSVIAEQLKVKKIIREYNAAMPFNPQTGMACLEKLGIRHGSEVYFEPRFAANTATTLL